MSNMQLRLDMVECLDAQFKARGLRVDANETATFARELEWLEAQAIEAKYTDLKGLTLVPVVGNGIMPGARTHRWREVDGFGSAEMLDAMTPEEFPTADIKGAENTGKFRNIGAKYIYTIEDLRARPSMTLDVESERSKLARRAIEEKLDHLVWDATSGPFTGLLNDSNSQNDTTAAGTPDWESGTESTDVATILTTFRTVLKNLRSDTKRIFEEADFVLSTACMEKMSLFIPSTTVGGGMTVADFLLKYVPGVRSISHCNRLDGAGASGKDRMLAFPRDPQVIDCLVPTRFESFPPQLSGMAFQVFCAAKYGGLRIKHPKAIRRVDITVT